MTGITLPVEEGRVGDDLPRRRVAGSVLRRERLVTGPSVTRSCRGALMIFARYFAVLLCVPREAYKCRIGPFREEDEMRPITRRRFLQYGVGAGAALAVPWAWRIPGARAAPGGKLAKYVQPVPLPGSGIVVAARADRTSTPSPRPRSRVSCIRSCRRHRCGRTTTAPGSRDRPDRSGWRSWRRAAHRSRELHSQSARDLPGWLPVDTRLTPLGNEVRLMTHLHGGFVAADSDGNPAVTPERVRSG